MSRLAELERQIKVQEDALVKCSSAEAPIHAYLLERLTEEWCVLVKGNKGNHKFHAPKMPKMGCVQISLG